MVARRAHNPEVVSSSLTPATKIFVCHVLLMLSRRGLEEKEF